MKSSLGIVAIATVQVVVKVVQTCGPFRWVAGPKIGMAGISIHQEG
jgi:hypothetical protein